MQGETDMKALRFLEYSFRVNDNGSITFEDIESEKLGVKPGDGFMAFVDTNKNEITLRKFDITQVEHIVME
jgi:bifunctional DNA-binding transcriptional regulator/antitoxin component of YhaV-PrlF toxin-antitoxin module